MYRSHSLVLANLCHNAVLSSYWLWNLKHFTDSIICLFEIVCYLYWWYSTSM